MSDALPKKAILLVNTMSRTGAEAFEEACQLLGETDIELIDAVAMDDPMRIDAIVKDAVARAPMVIIGGGDGSLSSNIDHFVGTDTVFAALPLGTANSFAHTIDMPLALSDAIAMIAAGRKRRIDVGKIENHCFINAAALGLSPLIAETVPDKLKKYLGKAGYLIWALRSLVRFRPFRLRLTREDGKCDQLWATEIRIANGTHHGGVELIERARLDDGEITIQAVTGTSVVGLAWSWFATLSKLKSRHGTVREWHGKSFTLDTRPHQDISIDGEVDARTPVEIRCLKGAVWIAAPREGQRQSDLAQTS